MHSLIDLRCVVAVSEYHRDYYVSFSSHIRLEEANSDLFDAATIWETARATSAASTFFKPIAIGNPPQSFVDGALGWNNPIEVLWEEARDLWRPAQGSFEDVVECVISIGTGVPSDGQVGKSLFEVIDTLEKISTQTEITANRFRSNHERLVSENRLFRFNLDGLGSIGLHEAKKAGEIANATGRYGNRPEVKEMFRKVRDLCYVTHEAAEPSGED